MDNFAKDMLLVTSDVSMWHLMSDVSFFTINFEPPTLRSDKDLAFGGGYGASLEVGFRFLSLVHPN